MAENKIELKSIRDLLGMNFFIPSYQRGYRWTYQQVYDLLNDVNEFNPIKDGKFYCLQPLVIHKQNKEDETLAEIKLANSLDEIKSIISGKWNVIDGQQRLTTIYLVLSIVNEPIFCLQYERESFIKNIDEIEEPFSPELMDVKEVETDIVSLINSKWEILCKNDKDRYIDNPDMYHLFLAKSIIYLWWQKMDGEKKESFKYKILNQVKFLWYDIGDDVDEHKLFENLNTGKIALTNTELIKALFIRSVEGEIITKELKQSAIADEFDQMERTLRKDDMWYFLAGNNNKPSSCLDLLFNLILDSDILDSDKQANKYKDKDYRSFFYFKDLLIQNKYEVIWDKVRNTFHILEGWYEESMTFNLIGYLRAIGEPLTKILTLYKRNNKLEFVKKLKNSCWKTIGDNYLDCRFDKDKYKVRKVLLLFNVAILLEKPEEKARFSFKSYHQNNWDVEHISPQNPNLNNEELKSILTEKQNENEPSLVELFPVLEELVKAINDADEEKISKEKDKFFAIKDDDIMALSNLTLLSDHDNRGIGNNFFFAKRHQLKEYYQNGSYIPVGSLNVFCKFYSSNPRQPLFWDKTDAEDYLKKIEETITNFKKSTLCATYTHLNIS